MSIHGINVFSRHSTGGVGKVGGLSGSAFVDIEDLDLKVDAMTNVPEWLADYEAMRKRREEDRDR